MSDVGLFSPLTAGSISSLVLEGIKWVFRKYVVKNEEFDFPPIFYELGLPLLNAFFGLLLFLLGFGEGEFIAWSTLLEWFLSVLISLGTYAIIYKPFKEYRKSYLEGRSG